MLGALIIMASGGFWERMHAFKGISSFWMNSNETKELSKTCGQILGRLATQVCFLFMFVSCFYSLFCKKIRKHQCIQIYIFFFFIEKICSLNHHLVSFSFLSHPQMTWLLCKLKPLGQLGKKEKRLRKERHQ